jgi:hypothetical protein
MSLPAPQAGWPRKPLVAEPNMSKKSLCHNYYTYTCVTTNATANEAPKATNELVVIVQCTPKRGCRRSCCWIATYADAMGVSCTNANDHQH